MLRRPRAIQIQSVFRPVALPPTPAVVFSASWQGSNERPWQFQHPAAERNYLAPFVFWTPIGLGEAGITRAAFQGSDERWCDFQRGDPKWANYLKPSVFWIPIGLGEAGITGAAFQGSNERWLGFQQGDPRWANYLKPSVFWTPISLSEAGITAAAWQGSFVGAPVLFPPGRYNYLAPSFFAPPKKINNPVTLNIVGTFLSMQQTSFTMSFGVTCNWQGDSPLFDSFTPDGPAVQTYTQEGALVISWGPDAPYCKPGQP